eukprot:844318-Rhodomonas_salina.1
MSAIPLLLGCYCRLLCMSALCWYYELLSGTICCYGYCAVLTPLLLPCRRTCPRRRPRRPSTQTRMKSRLLPGPLDPRLDRDSNSLSRLLYLALRPFFGEGSNALCLGAAKPNPGNASLVHSGRRLATGVIGFGVSATAS